MLDTDCIDVGSVISMISIPDSIDDVTSAYVLSSICTTSSPYGDLISLLVLSNRTSSETGNPTLSNLTIYSDNPHNTSLATLDDTLNITIEDLASANITILGYTYTMSTSGMVANASVTVDASHADGQVEFSITALDLAGNSLTVTQANLNSLDITIDKNIPSVSNLTLYSNNLNSSLAKSGDLINITLEVSENIYNATLQIFGTETSMTESNNIAYTTISVLQNSPNGLAAFNITAYDGAGNEFNVTQNDASANVIIDTANPTLSNLTIYSDNAHNTSLATLDDTLNITITANEDLSSANITLLGATYAMSTSGIVANASITVDASHADGQVEFSITALDLAGNSLTVTQANLNSLDITIDKNIPSVSNLTLYSIQLEFITCKRSWCNRCLEYHPMLQVRCCERCRCIWLDLERVG